jgi:hypothetical protein
MNGDPLRRIEELLEEHPEGLTIASIADILGFHRHTVAKYVKELAKRGKIKQRKVGSATLCYYNGSSFFSRVMSVFDIGVKSLMSLKSQAKLISFVILAGILLSQSMIIAQNVTKLINDSLSNVSGSGNIELFEGNETLTTTTTVKSLESNETTTTSTTTSTSITTSSTTTTTAPPSITKGVKLDVSLHAPSDVVRGEEVRITATIINVGDLEAKNISVAWDFENAVGFEILSASDECERLNPNESCDAWVLVKPSYSTQLGENKIRVVVTYE